MKKNLRPQQAAPVVRASAGNSKESAAGVKAAWQGSIYTPFAGDEGE